jgi:hypothetical protein
MKEMPEDEFNKIETVLLKRSVRVKEAGKTKVELKNSGTRVKVSGNEKIQLLSSGAGEVVADEKGSSK